MFDLSVYKVQGLYTSIATGLGVMALMALTYLEIWRPRKAEPEPQAGIKGIVQWWVYNIPWVITFTLVGLTLFVILYTLYGIKYPQDW